jgi:bifunctional UDP-N-acetylglucosamine pyrophosphorylase/glucosamine-1-phosphate N-acetyltransferase
MAKKEKIKILILAAGKGTRMKTDEPKALAILQGKPFLQHILNTIKKLDPTIKPIIVVGYKKERIKQFLGDRHIYVEQHKQLGTGHAVMSAKKAIDDDSEIILVISADQPLISKETIESIISKHKEKNPTVTMATVFVPDFENWRTGLYYFGRIIRETNGLIKKIIEFKDTNDKERKIKELNPALYAFDAKWLWDNIDKLKNDNAQGEFYLTDMIKMAFDQKKKIETIQITNIIEALQPNSKEELETLERFISQKLHDEFTS